MGVTNVSYGGQILMSWARRIRQARSVSEQSHHHTTEGRRVLFLVSSPSSQAMPSLIRAPPSAVYDVANRESFDALPRWYSELETYVSDSVVKILVGNKVDKVSRTALSRLIQVDNHCRATRSFRVRFQQPKRNNSQRGCPRFS